MNIVRKNLPQSQVSLSVSLDTTEMQDYKHKTLTKIGKDITVPGFRTGSAPKEMI
jgi:FKBP-type peptidyl-prolyl cis-trans isomerase (trigger factor)